MCLELTVNEADSQVIRDYAARYNLDFSTFIVKTVLEKIEEEQDLRAYEEAMTQYRADPTTYSHEEVGKMLGLRQ